MKTSLCPDPITLPTVNTAPPTKPPTSHRLLLAAPGGFAALALGIIIITITNKDGTKTSVRVPDGIETDVQASPGSKVVITQADDVSPAARFPPPAAPVTPNVIVNAPLSQAIDYAAERKAAERFLKLDKGSLVLFTNKDRYVQVPKDPLPDEPFQIVRVTCNSVDLSNEQLEIFAGCRGIEQLDLQVNPRLTTAGLQALDPLFALKELYINATPLGEQNLAFLGNYPNLTALCLTVNQPEILLTLPDLPTLTSFVLSHGSPERIGDDGLKTIVQKCPGLQYIVVNDPKVRSLVPLAGLQELRRYDGSGSQFSDTSIDTLAALPFFEELQVNEFGSPSSEAITKA